MKMTFVCEHEDGTKVTFESDKVFLPDILEAFEYFLKGSGFSFDGQVDIVDNESPFVYHKCPVCKIPAAEMEGHKCWDKQCPLEGSAVNAN